MANEAAEPEPRFRPWAIVTAALLGLAMLVAIIWGLALAYHGGQTPAQSYLFTAVFALLSVAGGWIVAVLMYQSQSHDRQIVEQRRQEELERTARSAVTRSFRIMRTLGRIQSHTEDEATPPVNELRTRLRVIREAAIVTGEQTEDAIQDWRRFAPAIVDDEIEKAKNSIIRQGDGWNE